MLYEPAGLSLHFLFIYTRSFVAPDFLKTSRHTSQQKGGQRRSFSKRFLIQAPVIIMKIIDSHLHFCPGYPHFDEIAIEAGHINNEEHLRECFQKYNIVGGIVMGNRGVHPDNHTYPDFLRYCVGVEARKLTPEKIQKTCDLVEENLKRNTCVGIKLYPGYDSIYVTDERFEPIYDLAKAYKKPVAIHTGQTAGSKAFIKYSHPLTLDEAAVRHARVGGGERGQAAVLDPEPDEIELHLQRERPEVLHRVEQPVARQVPLGRQRQEPVLPEERCPPGLPQDVGGERRSRRRHDD